MGLFARMLSAEKPVSLCYTLGLTEHTCGVDNVTSCANLQMLLGNLGMRSAGVNPLRGQNNVQGACDMGALPNVYTGYQQVSDAKTRKNSRMPGLVCRGALAPHEYDPLLAGAGFSRWELRLATEYGPVAGAVLVAHKG
jgi:anaerobic selenocysteine-containing dehydrogenase